jgi:CheY-like chemotaxis protein
MRAMPTSPDANIAHAQRLLDQLRVGFVAELPDRLEELEELVLKLNQEKTFQETFETLYRKTHSLKGSAGTFGLPVITQICHQNEECLNHIAGQFHNVNDEFMDNCLAYVDLMRQALDDAQRADGSPSQVEASLAKLRSYLQSERCHGLIVESLKVNTNLYLGVLKSLPIQFSIADNGYQALERLLQQHFDVVITGMELPMLNGAALIAATRLNGRGNRDIKSILITSGDVTHLPESIAPSYVVRRDQHMTERLRQAVREIIENQVKRA